MGLGLVEHLLGACCPSGCCWVTDSFCLSPPSCLLPHVACSLSHVGSPFLVTLPWINGSDLSTSPLARASFSALGFGSSSHNSGFVSSLALPDLTLGSNGRNSLGQSVGNSCKSPSWIGRSSVSASPVPQSPSPSSLIKSDSFVFRFFFWARHVIKCIRSSISVAST